MLTSAQNPNLASASSQWDTLKKRSLRNQINACTELNATATIQSSQTSPTVEEVRVDMADMKAENRPIKLVTSVGSCVAICLHDSKNKCGGLAHIMLPNSAISPQELLPSKFANTAVPALVKLIRKITVNPSALSAKIAGGANMFPNMKNNALNIGAKNVEAVKEALKEHKIKLIAEDVGGSHGRRVTFNIGTGTANVRRFNGEAREL